MDKIAILLGGSSTERDISLRSGHAITNALLNISIDAYPIDVKDINLNILKTSNFKKIFIALHGRGGEDGTIQGVLEFLNLPYTGSGILASALSMDKIRTKEIWQSNNLPIPKYVKYNKNEIKKLPYKILFNNIEHLNLPVIIKPNQEGSSFGISKISSLNEFKNGINKALYYNDEILIEEWLNGAEYSVAIIGKQIFPSVRIKPKNEFFDYNAKYINNDTEYFCPSGLSIEKEKEIKKLAFTAYKIIGCKGWGRVDILEDKNGIFKLLEVNTSPGMTPHSIIPKAAKEIGLSFSELVKKILQSTE